MSEPDKFEAWAIVELFGHQRIAGRLTEQTIGGCNFVRVDVPEVNGNQAFTKLFGQGAIYAITFVDEAIAKAAVDKMRPRPVSVYDIGKLEVNTVRDRIESGRMPRWDGEV